MATLRSYDLNGQKLSFANWVSNITPTDTPFLSMIKKAAVEQTVFDWQTDSLQTVVKNAQTEGSEALDASASFSPTNVLSNYTQILRKTVSVSDTAEAVATYGRDNELSYQMEKAVQELKRDLEWALLNNLMSSAGSTTTSSATGTPRMTAGFAGLCSAVGIPDSDTGAVLNFDVPTLTEDAIHQMCRNLYMNGSNTTVIMFHPKHARFFSKLQESPTRRRFFDNTPEYDILVNVFVDQFDNKFKLIPNRYMDPSRIFFFNPDNWEQKVLRPPKKSLLCKVGNYTQWMIEMEVGLLHINPEASGIINIRANKRCEQLATKTVQQGGSGTTAATFGVDRKKGMSSGGNSIDFTFKAANATPFYTVHLFKDGELVQEIPDVTNVDKVFQFNNSSKEEHEGVYKFVLVNQTTGMAVDESDGMYIEIG